MNDVGDGGVMMNDVGDGGVKCEDIFFCGFQSVNSAASFLLSIICDGWLSLWRRVTVLLRVLFYL